MESYEIAVKIKDPFEQTKNLHNLGNVYYDMSNMKAALEYHHLSLDMAKGGKFRVLEAYALGALARDYLKLGKVFSFLKYNNLALKITREMKLHNFEGIILHNYGWFFEIIRLRWVARHYYRRSEVLGEASGSYLYKK